MASTLIFANSFNENNTSTVRDYSENLNDSATAVSLTITADTFGYYLDLDGANDYYTISNATDYTAGDFTICGQIYIASGKETRSTIIGTANGGNVPFSVYYLSGNIVFETETSGGVTQTISFVAIKDEWSKFVCTYDQSSNTMTFYYNSIVDFDTDTNTPEVQNGAFEIGALGAADFFKGRIRDIRFYNSLANDNFISTFFSNNQGDKISMRTFDVEGSTITPTDNFAVGDLIVTDKFDPFEAVVYAKDTEFIHVLPFNTYSISAGDFLSRIGHRWDTARQSAITMRRTDEQICIHGGVNTFSGFNANSFVTTCIDKNGIKKTSYTKSANYTVKNYEHTFYCDTSGGSFTLTLPASPDTDEEHLIIMIQTPGTLTVNGNGNNINNSATKKLTTQFQSMLIKFDGTRWIII